MTPIEFPEQTIVWAKNQPPYLPLPAFTNERETISCWRLNDGNVKRHTLNRLDSFVDGMAQKRLTYKGLTQ